MTDTPSSLAAMTEPERRILHLKALIGPATDKTPFLNCLNRVRLENVAWSNKTLTPVLQSLYRRGLLAEDLACAPDIIHRLALEALASADGPKMVEAVRAALPQRPSNSWDWRAVETSTLRWQRLAVLLNDEEEYRRVINLGSEISYRAQPTIFDRHFAGIELGADWLASRHPAFQQALLSAKADAWIATGSLSPDYPRLMALCHDDPALRATAFPMLADFQLLSGTLAALDELLATTDALPHMAAAFQACRTLLAGAPAEAVPQFATALKLHRKATRRRKGGLPGYMGLLHLCALLAADDAGLHAEIEALTETDDLHPGLLAIRSLLELARNKEGTAREFLQAGMAALGMTPLPPPISGGLLAVAAALVDPAQLQQRAAKIFIPLFHRVESSMPLTAAMLAEALAQANADKPASYRSWLDSPGNPITFRFLGLIPFKAPWERALESIEAMLSPVSPARTETGPRSKRLVWQIHPDSGAIQPLEQSLQARGGWSAGRNVALKRLYQSDPALTYLDEFDRRAIHAIRRTAEDWYNREYFECPADSMLPLLVGHPRVFDARSPGQSVELVESRPELVVSSSRAGFRLSLSHVATETGAFIEIETPSRWRVVVVDDKAVEAAAVLSAQGISIPKAARDRLTELGRLQAPALPLRFDTGEIEDTAVEAGDPAPVVRLLPLDEGLKVSLVVRPAGAEGPYFLPGQGGRTVNTGSRRLRRDLEAELRLARALGEACPSLGGEGPEWILDTLLSSLELLDELRSLPSPPPMEWPEGEKLSLSGTASASRFKASIKGASVKGAGEWFALGGSIAVNEEMVLDLKDLLERMEQSQGRFVPLDNGAFLALDRHFRQQLERLSRLGDGLKIPRAAGVVVRDLLEGAASVKSDARWKDFTRRLDEAEAWQPALPAGFTAELRDYQRDGFIWMSRLERWGAGALLADDMGLGKTVQAIGVMLAQSAAGPILVVAPTSVCGNWERELARFAPGLRTTRLAEAGDRGETLSALAPGDVLIASYGLLAREAEKLTALPWAMAVLDEAQAIKNADSQRAQASRGLQAGFRLALTGTPVENDLDELWSLFAFVDPGLLGSREGFGRRFATPIARDNDPRAKAALKALIRPFLLRRTKAAVLEELPARTEQTLLVEQGEEERAFYEALRRHALERLEEAGDQRTRIHILAEITRLRQACCHPALVAADTGLSSAKLETFLELREELRKGHHRALVFSQFVGHLEKIRHALDTAGVTYQYLDGATPAREREKRVAAFQAGEGEMFLISLKAGGFGLNLTAADYVIHLDPWWNPAVEDQASDRAHRIGQRKPVTVYRLIVKDSIEEGILALHRHKRDLADALLEGADASARLSEEDLLNLIRSGT